MLLLLLKCASADGNMKIQQPARPLLYTVNKDLHKIYLNYNGHINNSNKTEKTENNCISGSKFAIVISTICCSSQKLFVIFFFSFILPLVHIFCYR